MLKTPILENNFMPDISAHLSLNKAIATRLEKVKRSLKKQQVALFEQHHLSVPGHYVTNAIAVASAIERLYEDLLQEKEIDITKYSEMYDIQDSSHGNLSIYVNDETSEIIGSIARLISAQSPDIKIHWRGKINSKKITSIAIFYCDDKYK